MGTEDIMLATMEEFEDTSENKLALVINWIMMEQTKAKDDHRVCFCNLEGKRFRSIKAAEVAIDRGEFCACVEDD
ncbi:hypothetical protein ES703_05406 [subsurface metagenome]